MDQNQFAASVHGASIGCSDCHAGITEYPHPERAVKTLAEFRAGFREACKQCHFDKYALSLDGVHYAQLSQGNGGAPWCTDCHGSHAIAARGGERLRISETCSGCHFDVYDAYAASVHGKALVEADNPDVPVCTDCHRSHDIADPRTESWLIRTPEICAKCHTDPARMSKYGITTDVLNTYVADFHGTTVTLFEQVSPDTPTNKPVCTDCHGVHDISLVDNPATGIAIKENAASLRSGLGRGPSASARSRPSSTKRCFVRYTVDVPTRTLAAIA